MAVVFKHKGDFHNTEKLLTQYDKNKFKPILESYGRKGIAALSAATPIDTGETSNSWGYEIDFRTNSFILQFTNSHVNNGIPIAILIQYGHGTRHGGYVPGRDFINPALVSIFDDLAEDIWKEITK